MIKRSLHHLQLRPSALVDTKAYVEGRLQILKAIMDSLEDVLREFIGGILSARHAGRCWSGRAGDDAPRDGAPHEAQGKSLEPPSLSEEHKLWGVRFSGGLRAASGRR